MWEQYGIVGKIHHGSPAKAAPYRKVIERRTAKALWVIEQFGEESHYVSISFGVDSLVAYHLARRVFSAIPVMWVNQGPLAEWPDCLALKDLMVAQGLPLVELQPDVSLYDWYRTHGIPQGSSMGNAEDEHLNEALMYAPIRHYQESAGMRGFIWGLRWKGEGGHRVFVIKQHGEIYTRKADGVSVCSPVGNWTKAEIFAYIDLHGLPYPAMYDLNRAEIRNGPPIGVSALNMGRVMKLKIYFPDIWRIVISEFPELQRYT